VEIFESTPAKTSCKKRPTDSDEFVYVLSGKLILTEVNGKKQEFHPGRPAGRVQRHVGDAGELLEDRGGVGKAEVEKSFASSMLRPFEPTRLPRGMTSGSAKSVILVKPSTRCSCSVHSNP
jgi:hypothetical protein